MLRIMTGSSGSEKQCIVTVLSVDLGCCRGSFKEGWRGEEKKTLCFSNPWLTKSSTKDLTLGPLVGQVFFLIYIKLTYFVLCVSVF